MRMKGELKQDFIYKYDVPFKKGWAKCAKDFYRYQYDVVLVDYRGFGKSTGRRSEKMMLNDMQVVYDSLAVQFHTKRG